MAKLEERPRDDWGEVVATWTFWATVVLAVLYVASVFLFVM
jgi:hypothetical protein